MKNYFNCKFILIALIIGGIFNNKLMAQYTHNEDVVDIGSNHAHEKALRFNGANNKYQIIQFGGFSGPNYMPSWEIYRPASASELHFRNSSQSTVMTLLNNGNIGIGTSTPAEKLHIAGAIRGGDSDNGALRINTNHGYVTIGAKDADYVHFHTDRNRYYFNKKILVDEGIISSYNENLQLQTGNNYAYTTRITALNSNGNVGIGTSTPAEKLHIAGAIRGGDSDNGALRINTNHGYVTIGAKDADYVHFHTDRDKYYFNKKILVDEGIISSHNENLQLQTGNNYAYTTRITALNSNGNVGIGTATPTEKLEVAGKIKADGVVLNMGTFPDYVFEEDYDLMPLEELETYVKTHKHLPNVPSEQEVLKNGADLGQLNHVLVEKVEELTLYTIGQEKALEAQQQQIEALTDALDAVNKQLTTLKNQ